MCSDRYGLAGTGAGGVAGRGAAAAGGAARLGGVAAGFGAAASSFLTTSSVRSRPGSAQTMPASARAEQHLQRPSPSNTCSRIGMSFFWNSCCSSCCSSLISACASCWKRSPSTRLPLDVLLELRARGVVHHAAARSASFCWFVLELLGLRRRLRSASSVISALTLALSRLAFDRLLRDALEIRRTRSSRPAGNGAGGCGSWRRLRGGAAAARGAGAGRRRRRCGWAAGA